MSRGASLPRVCRVLAAALALGCGSGSNGDGGSSGAGASGGVPNGGSGANAASGGTAGSSAGAQSGGASNGGASNGGASNGGASNGGASNGGASNGGASNGGASNGGAGGAGGATARACKRGIAANVAPSAAFSPGVGWWYNWAREGDGAGPDIEFVPMAWDESSVNTTFQGGAAFLLGFNEPNFKAQADLTAEAAATHWRTLEANAATRGLPLVSPAVNFCGPAGDCNGTDPYAYLRSFFAACSGCRVDFVAVHWYNCDLASLRDYLEPGGGLEGFEQFGKPIWLTEFACAIGSDTSVAAQERFMREAIPYLEGKANVFRYSWFSADPIPNAELVNDDGSPTSLGRLYAELPGDCAP